MLNGWWRLGRILAGGLFRAAFRLRFEGTENIPPTGPAIIAANHVSVLDPVVIALGPADRGRTLQFLALARFFEVPVLGWALRRIGQIPIRRGQGDWEAVEEVAAVIRRGSLAGIFPEGRVGPGDLQPGKKGAARIALAAGVPVIPVGIWGTQRRWPLGGARLALPIRPTVAVVFGESIEVHGDPRSRQDVRLLTDRIMGELAELSSTARRMAGDPER